jgi:multiple sugar transport system substrate-binding protein
MRRRWQNAAAMLLGLGLMGLLGLWSWARTLPIEVSVLMPAPFAEATGELVAQFNANQRRIHLSVARGPLETEAVSDLAISSLLLGSTPYDLLLMDVTWTPKYAAAGWLEPLEPWLGADALNDLAPGAELGNAFDGHLWRFPLVADMGLLYWRTDLMESPPRTPEELVAISRSLQRNRRVPWGYVWQGKQYEGLSCVFVEMLDGFGGHWIRDGEPHLDDAAALKTATWLRDLVVNGVTPPSVANMAEPEALQTFQAGDAAFMRNWPYAWTELNKPGSALAGKVGITTMVSAAGHAPAATQGSWGLAVLSGSSHKDAAVEVLQYLTSAEAQRDLNLHWGYTPTRLSVFEDPDLIAASPVLPELQRALADAVLRPLTPVYAQLSDLLYRELNSLISGDVDVASGLASLQRNSERLAASVGGQL